MRCNRCGRTADDVVLVKGSGAESYLCPLCRDEYYPMRKPSGEKILMPSNPVLRKRMVEFFRRHDFEGW